MVVYKAFFKVIFKNLAQLMIYFIVFISLAVALANTNFKSQDTNFAETKVNIAFINYDYNSLIVEGLRDYVSKNANIIDIPNNMESLQDALFFREIEYIVRVPKGFTEELLDGKTPQLEKSSVPASASGIHLDNIINKYLNTVKTYTSNMENLPEVELLGFIGNDLVQTTEVKLSNTMKEISKNQRRAFYFNYMSYAIFSILILGVCTVMIVFNNSDLKKRNLCSPVKLRNMNFQMVLGNLSFAVLTWLVIVSASFILYGSFMLTTKGLFFLLNSFIFSLAALSVSYLIANVIKSRNAMSAAANVFSLGSCFISGVFVPQALLGKTVLKIASFTPSYWYVKSNNIISNLDNVNMENLTPIFLNMLIMIGFAVAILSVTLVMIKQKRMSN